jgi:hypothetical protein
VAAAVVVVLLQLLALMVVLVVEVGKFQLFLMLEVLEILLPLHQVKAMVVEHHWLMAQHKLEAAVEVEHLLLEILELYLVMVGLVFHLRLQVDL